MASRIAVPDVTVCRRVLDRLSDHVSGVYRVPVRRSRELSRERGTGTVTGAEICLAADLPPEQAVFVLAHLFGHTVQWNTSAEQRAVGLMPDWPEHTPDRRELGQFRAYEREATEYALGLVEQAGLGGPDGLGPWLAACWDGDWRYLMASFHAGRYPSSWSAFVRTDVAPTRLRPRRVPSFSPREWGTRGAF